MKNVLSVKFKNTAEFIKNNYIVLLLSCFYILGIVAGAFIFNNACKNQTELLLQFAGGLGVDGDCTTTFINGITVYFLYFIVIALLGTSLSGKYLLYFVPFIKGLSYGYISGFIFAVFDINGFAVNLLGILPQNVLTGMLIIYACKLSVSFSKGFIEFNKKYRLKYFILCLSVLFILCIIVSLMDVFLTGIVIKNYL